MNRAARRRRAKDAEKKVKEWLDRPDEGYCFDRVPDQMTGLWGSQNICDFILYKYPYFYYLESKATENDRFDFTMISDYQYKQMYQKSKIEGVKCYVILLFATYQRVFLLNIQDIHDARENRNIKSLNIKKIAKWDVPYAEIKTVPSRKKLLDYSKIDNVL